MFFDSLRTACGCPLEQANCSDFFTKLDDAGKTLFLLGGPVDGRTPERNIDAASASFVASAYASRSTQLNATSSDPLVVDLTTQRAGKPSVLSGNARSSSSNNSGRSGDIRSYFSVQLSASLSSFTDHILSPNRAGPSRRTRYLRAHARSPRNNSGHAADSGSGPLRESIRC